MQRRSVSPGRVAPLIPLWGLLAFFGSERLQGTRFLPVFVTAMLMLLAALFAFVVQKTLDARRKRR